MFKRFETECGLDERQSGRCSERTVRLRRRLACVVSSCGSSVVLDEVHHVPEALLSRVGCRKCWEFVCKQCLC